MGVRKRRKASPTPTYQMKMTTPKTVTEALWRMYRLDLLTENAVKDLINDIKAYCLEDASVAEIRKAGIWDGKGELLLDIQDFLDGKIDEEIE